ncbi:MAG: MFS transporter [Deltaproteobacteria bacterium]|nr:MFS transporter [Deltaproteobacteria bacterium]
MKRNYLVFGFVILLLSAFIDSARGPLLPIISQSLSLPYGRCSWFLVAGNFAAVAVNFLLFPLLHFFGQKHTLTLIGIFGVLSGLLVPWVSGFASLMAIGAAFGSLIAMMGSMCNLLVIRGSDPKSRSNTLCGLHVMYGVGALTAPTVASILLQNGWGWRAIFATIAPFFLLLTISSAKWFPKDSAIRASTFRQSLAIAPKQILFLLAFSTYVAGEITISMWMTTYLLEAQHVPVVQGATYVAGFFLVMALSRAGCIWVLKAHHEIVVVWGALILTVVFFLLGLLGHLWAFPLCGILGPFFPVFLAWTSRLYPEQSRSLTLWILTSVQLTLALANILIGKLTDQFGVAPTYRLAFVWLGAAMLFLALCLRLGGKKELAS